mgnify:CR=1 FL=1
MATKKTYVLDTSVYLTEAAALRAFTSKNNDVVIPLKVLEEIDKHKKRQDSVGHNARQIIRRLDELRADGNLHKGVRTGRGMGVVSARGYNKDTLPADWSASHPDNQIIATALTLKKENPKRRVILVSRDINMRVKCDSIGLLTEGYQASQIVESPAHVYTGFSEYLVDDQEIENFYNGEDVFADKEEIVLYANQYAMLVSNSNPKKTALVRFKNYETPFCKIQKNKGGIWGIKARNKEQAFALDLLMNPDIHLVSLVGKAGSGKTLCAIAAGLQQVLEHKNSTKEPCYNRLIVSRPVQPLGKDIGFLPGTMEEKMGPWLKPIQDNLQHLMGDDSATLEIFMDRGKIEIEAITYIRGRSISNAFIIIDEAQNLTRHELKTIVTRVGENTKIVLTGDVEQIDNVYIDEVTNGLTYAVEKMKEYAISGHITLTKGERSKIATLASKIL